MYICICILCRYFCVESKELELELDTCMKKKYKYLYMYIYTRTCKHACIRMCIYTCKLTYVQLPFSAPSDRSAGGFWQSTMTCRLLILWLTFACLSLECAAFKAQPFFALALPRAHAHTSGGSAATPVAKGKKQGRRCVSVHPTVHPYFV